MLIVQRALFIQGQAYDQKVVKRHYPRESETGANRLQFLFDADPNLNLIKNKIAIHLTVEVPEKYIPSNGFASKLFGQTEVSVNSQMIDNSNTE